MCIFQNLCYGLKLLPLQGATAPARDTQGAASLALGYVLHWAFSPPLLNQKLEVSYYSDFNIIGRVCLLVNRSTC